MALVQEKINDYLIKTYSDKHVYIQGGEPYGLYEEAIDPIDEHRQYEETDIPIPVEDTEATEEDYQKALENLGVIFDEEI